MTCEAAGKCKNMICRFEARLRSNMLTGAEIGNMKRALLIVSLLIVSFPGYAADRSGEFFTRGVGSQTCAAFLAEKSKNSAMYFLFRSWVNGYLSAYNQMTSETYDIAAAMSIDDLDGSIEATCKAYPDQQFWTAAFALTRALEPHRLKAKSDGISATVGNRTVLITRDTMRAVQQALKDRGHYRGTVDGIFGPRTGAAIMAFQRAQKLAVTGVPDRATVSGLLRKAE